MTRLLLVLVALALIPSAQSGAQETARWLSSSSDARAYGSIAEAAVELAASVAGMGIPEALFLSRLKEGVAKKAPPAVLLEALRTEAGNLSTAASVLRRAFPAEGRSGMESAIAGAALALRSGVRAEELDAISAACVSAGGTADRAVAVASLLSAIDPGRALEEPLRMEFAVAAARSRLRADRLASLRSAFARGRAAGIGASRLARLIAAELSSGGALVGIDRILENERRVP